VSDEDIKEAVREAVREELRSANIIDGPTHVRHHEFIERWCKTMDTVGTTTVRIVVTAVVGAIIAAIVYFTGHYGGGK